MAVKPFVNVILSQDLVFGKLTERKPQIQGETAAQVEFLQNVSIPL